MSPKKKTMGQGKTSLAGNFTASFPWLKNKTFLIPAVALVLVLSTVGVVSAVHGGVFSPSGPGKAEVSEEESGSEEEIGFACVAGTEICEEVKSILLNTDYEEVVTNWTRESLIAHLKYKYNRSRIFATDVVDAVKFDWGDGSSYAGGSEPEPSLGSSSSTARPATTCQGGVALCASATPVNPPTPVPQTGLSAAEAAKLMIDSANSSVFANSRLKTIDYLVEGYSIDRSEATTAVDALSVDWNLAAAKASRWMATQSWTSFISRVEWLEELENRYLYTPSEAAYGVDSVNIDWNANASKAAGRILLYWTCDEFVVSTEYGPSANVGGLVGSIMLTYGFTEDEAYSGAYDQLEMEGDWPWKLLPNCSP